MGSLLTNVLLVLYLLIMVLIFYICFLADPEASSTTKYLVETLPQQSWIVLERLVGKRTARILGFFADRFLLVVYCTVVFGSWSIIFANVYPWMDEYSSPPQHYISQHHKLAGYGVFVACVTSWRKAMNSSPGIITVQTLSKYDHFPYDHLLFVPGVLCRTKHLPRLARSKYDRFKYHENIPRFDHFCGWVYNTIGEENYRWFLLFVFVHASMCGYGSYVVANLFYAVILEKRLLEVTFFDRSTGEETPATKWIIFQYLFQEYLTEAGLLLLMSVMCVALTLFLGYHIWLTSRGFTTNEAVKWDQIKHWYKRELQKYNKAVAEGKIDPNDENTNNHIEKPVVVDGDVTCTGQEPVPQQQQQQQQQQTETNEIRHPGPPPVNIYNRGLIENWKEVIFPISLRKVKPELVKSKDT